MCLWEEKGKKQLRANIYFYPVDAKDLEQLSRNKITHIVSIHESPQPLLQDITYLRIPLPDTPEANILAGISRSTTVVVAYVMAVTELSSQEVLEAIRSVRPVANPNPGFRQQLEEFGSSTARKVGAPGGRSLCHLHSPVALLLRGGAGSWVSGQERSPGAPDSFPVPLACRLGLALRNKHAGILFFPQIRRHLRQRYGSSPFNDEEEIKALLPVGRGAPRAEGARQGLVPRARDIKSTAPFLLRVKRTFSCIPACLK
ncbi:Dual specificity protein phosphatase 15 [Aix galericulata]|nr:Dual specificity protein phosphatase 15 [Aix galericulata]